jgi:osmotically inducible protein OsmC
VKRRKEYEMTEINRKAGAFWSGDSRNGKGLISTESKALYEQPYDYQTRFGASSGTNPEELIAAAHAACFSMALASTLKKKGFEPKKTDTNASCTVASKNGGYEITKMQLHVSAEVVHAPVAGDKSDCSRDECTRRVDDLTSLVFPIK